MLPLMVDDDLSDLYEQAPCGFVSTTPDGGIIKANATFLRWTGYTAEQLVGVRRLQDLLTVGGRIFFETHYSPLLRMQGWVREVALDVERADGTRLPAVLHSTVAYDTDGSPRVVRTALFDASERRAYERELLEERRRAEESEARARELAETLQQSLVPPAPPAIPGVGIGAAYRPARNGDEVGGDFYDVFELPNDEWALVIGDVCGKGAQAAAVTALVRYTVRALAIQQADPAAVLTRLNHALLSSASDRFCTVIYARIAARFDGEVQVRLAVAGHPLPLLLPSEGAVRPAGREGDVLGVFDQPEFHEDAFTLAPGDTLVCFTDGITEGRQGKKFYGDDRLRELLQRLRGESAAAIAGQMLAASLDFQGGYASDDIAAIAIQAPR